MIQIANRTYEVVVDHKNGWKPEALRERYSEVLERYDYIVGDWGYNQLRLRGFFKDTHPKATKESSIATLQDYLNEYCNFGCAYFIIEKVLSKQQNPGQQDTKQQPQDSEETVEQPSSIEEKPLNDQPDTEQLQQAEGKSEQLEPKQQQPQPRPHRHNNQPRDKQHHNHRRSQQNKQQSQGQSSKQPNPAKQHVKQQ